MKLKKHAEAKHIWGYSKRHYVCEGSTRRCPARGNVLVHDHSVTSIMWLEFQEEEGVEGSTEFKEIKADFFF